MIYDKNDLAYIITQKKDDKTQTSMKTKVNPFIYPT